jgi:hypothetical protein
MIKIQAYLKVTVLFFTSYFAQAQCEVFKSEISDVQNYMLQVSQLTDSLSTAAETASYDARLSTARTNTKTVMLLMGQAVTAAEEAVLLASEAQYDSESCGLVDVKSYTIDAERNAIDARDFAAEAFEDVKSASKSKNLGNLQFYMRKAQRVLREVRTSAEASVYAADNAHYSCSHNMDHAMADK